MKYTLAEGVDRHEERVQRGLLGWRQFGPLWLGHMDWLCHRRLLCRRRKDGRLCAGPCRRQQQHAYDAATAQCSVYQFAELVRLGQAYCTPRRLIRTNCANPGSA